MNSIKVPDPAADIKYSNFVMDMGSGAGDAADLMQAPGQASTGQEQIFEYMPEKKGEPAPATADPAGGAPGLREGARGEPVCQQQPPSSPEVRLKPGDAGGGFHPFAGLDDLEPIEKKSQYSDDNEDADAIADERGGSQDGRGNGGGPQSNEQRCPMPSQLQAGRGRANGGGEQPHARDEEELSKIINSIHSSDEQMGPLFDYDQLKLDFFGKQAPEHDRRSQQYQKFGGKAAGGARKEAAAAQEESITLKSGKKHKDKQGEVERLGHQKQAGREKMMVNNFMMETGGGHSPLQRFNNDNMEEDCKDDEKQEEDVRSPPRHDTRDVHFLMERYKEDNKGQGTTDICRLFSYWQANFCYHRAGSTDCAASANASASGPAPGILGPGPSGSASNNLNTIKSSIALMHDEKTSSFINYNSKSFNNKTYYNNDARTTPNQNHTDEDEDGGNFMRSREEQQCGRIGVATSQEPSPIPQARAITAGEADRPNAVAHYGRPNYQMEIIDNEFEDVPNGASNDDQQYQMMQNQQLQLSELKGSIASPNTNLHTIGSMDGDFNPKSINLNNQRIHHHHLQSKEKKPRVQVPKIQFNNFAKQHGSTSDKRAMANNFQVQISQISQLSQVSGSAGHQFGNAAPTPGSTANANGFVFPRDASNSLQKNLRQHSDSRQGQVDSILFSQKIKLDREKNINEIQLGNVKNQVLGGASGGGHQHHGSLLQNSSIGGATQNLQNSLLPPNLAYNNAANFSGGSIGLIAGREIDRNQLSVEIMNITPIMEEKEYYHNANTNFGPGGQGELNEFKIDDEPEEESGDTGNMDGKRNRNKGSKKLLREGNSKVKMHERTASGEEDRQQLQDDQHQFSFDKELNYFNPEADGGEPAAQKNHYRYEDEKARQDQTSNAGPGAQNQLERQAEDLSELMDLEEKILVNDLEQIDQRFSIDKIASSPRKSTKSSKRKHRSDRSKNLFRHMDDNYSSINFISNSEHGLTINLFVANKLFEPGSSGTKLHQRERRRFENNAILLKRDYRTYDGLLERQKLLSQLCSSLKMIRLGQNLPNVYCFRHFDLKSSVILNKLPQELANINELSPILDKKHVEALSSADGVPFTHLQLILSHSFLGLCRQYLTLHALLKGMKATLTLHQHHTWLCSLLAVYTSASPSDQQAAPPPAGLRSHLLHHLSYALNTSYNSRSTATLWPAGSRRVDEKAANGSRGGAGGAGSGRQSSGRRGMGEQTAARQAAVFDHLSSIESEGHEAQYEGDGDEGDVLEVLQRTSSYLDRGGGPAEKSKQGDLFNVHHSSAKAGAQGAPHTRLLKNDDTEYKERERKNLSKYRDRSEFSANSDLAALNLISKAEAAEPQANEGNILMAGESKNQGIAEAVKESAEKKNETAGAQPPSTTWVDQRGRRRKNRKVRNNKKDGNEDKPKSAFDLKNTGDEGGNPMLFKTPDEKQHAMQGNPIPQITMKSKFIGLNTTPNDKHKDDRKRSKTRRANKSKSNNKHRARHGSSKSKSKSRFSNNLGFAQLQNAIDNEEMDALENTQAIAKLLQAIDDGENELDQFISREEENYSKKFNNKVSEAERVLQNSRRDGSTNNRYGADSYRGAVNLGSGIVVNRDQSQTQRLGQGITDNLQQNQHHNSISNNSGSFYFPLSKKQGARDGAAAANRTNIKSNNISMHHNHPYNPRGAHSGSIYGLSGKKERSSVGGPDGGFCASSSNSSSSSTSSRNNAASCGGKSQNLKSISDIENKAGGSQIKNIQFKNVSTHQNYSQNSQLLTDRPNFDKKLDLGRLRNNLGNRHGGRQHNAAGGLGIFADKSNERQMSIVSGHSKYSNGNPGPGGGGHHYNVHNSSYTNRQRFPFNNNLVNRSSAAVGNQHHNYSNLQHHQQYSSLSRIGLQKISSGMSGGGYSNQSPSNAHHNVIYNNKLATGAIADITDGQKNSTRRSGLNNNIMLLEHTAGNTRQNTSGFLAHVNNNFQSTQNSYRTTTNHPPSTASANQQNPILLKLKTTQMSRGAAGPAGPQGAGHGGGGVAAGAYQGGAGGAGATMNPAIGNSMMLQMTSDYPLSQRGAPHHHSSMHSSITPKSFGGARGSGLLGPGETSQGGRDGDNLLQGVSPKKQMLNTQQKHTMQPILGQINLERSQTIGQSQRKGANGRGAKGDEDEMDNIMAGAHQLDQHDQILETEQLEPAHDQINIIDNELLEQDADDDYDKQILIKQNTDQQFDEFKVSSKVPRLSPGKGDRSADGVEGNFGQKYLRDTSSMSRNDSKEKAKKSVLSIKMRATTSFQGGHGGSSSITGVNGAQSSRLPGSHGLGGQNIADGHAGANQKTQIQQTSQIKLRVKSLKKGDNTLISTSNLNSSVSKASAEKIRTSSNSSMGTSGARMLRLKFKPRNFNSKIGEGELQKRSGDEQQDKVSSHMDEGMSTLVHGSHAQQHMHSQEQAKIQSARSGLKATDKRRDRIARGQRSQAGQDGLIASKQSSGNPATSGHHASKASFTGQNASGGIRSYQDSLKSKDNQSTLNSQQQQRGGPRSRLKQPSYTNLKGHTSIRGGPNFDSHKGNEGYASKFRGRDRDVKKDGSPQQKKQAGRDMLEQNYHGQHVDDKLLNTSLEKQQQQQHKTLVQHHYYAAASMAQQHNPPGQASSRSNQRFHGGPTSRRTAQTTIHNPLGESVSPQVPSRLHLSQQEQDNSLHQAQQQNHNLTSVSLKKQMSGEKIQSEAIGTSQNGQKSLLFTTSNHNMMQGNQEELAQKFQTAAGHGGARIGQAHKQAREGHQQSMQSPKNDCDRLIELLIQEFKRKKGKNIRADVPHSQQLQTLVTFWQESLSKQRILTKLLVKQQTFSAQMNTQMDTMRTATSLPSKLSDKEKWLLNFLEGTDTQQLLTLGKESTTRNYGELAMIDEGKLAQEICRFLKLDRSTQDFTPTPTGRDRHHNISNQHVLPAANYRATYQSTAAADYQAGVSSSSHHQAAANPGEQHRPQYSAPGGRAQYEQRAAPGQPSRNQNKPALTQTNSTDPIEAAISGGGSMSAAAHKLHGLGGHGSTMPSQQFSQRSLPSQSNPQASSGGANTSTSMSGRGGGLTGAGSQVLMANSATGLGMQSMHQGCTTSVFSNSTSAQATNASSAALGQACNLATHGGHGKQVGQHMPRPSAL